MKSGASIGSGAREQNAYDDANTLYIRSILCTVKHFFNLFNRESNINLRVVILKLIFKGYVIRMISVCFKYFSVVNHTFRTALFAHC